MLREMLRSVLAPVNGPRCPHEPLRVAPPDPFAPSIVTTWIVGAVPHNAFAEDPAARVASDVERLRIDDTVPPHAAEPRRCRAAEKPNRSPKVGKK